ncbi:HAD-IC family P-type ATPase [Glycomyces niveus]|uniref:HAD-IC family P-type ATPase n=1 Tax=Glycomyces niveus TaxID=2820287 RepID=A0ABS3U3U3_9ACTN|nr:HAD-IC family P-type ATPase [Glycomyces sp. NEAU-S30]MBO3733415.1 HAD-IC family P-type ATPase [Glycomyces sp. NEAU-S30]
MTTPMLAGDRGLTAAEVAERVEAGAVNEAKRHTSRPLSAILRANFFTPLNAVIGVLAVIAIGFTALEEGFFEGLKQGLFAGVIIANIAIGTIQELRAKRTLDKLSLMNQSNAKVLRDGEVQEIAPNLIVRDDLVYVEPGDRIVVDGPVVESRNLEIDESLLTGEADPVAKAPGDEVRSGSFAVAGTGLFRAEQIGAESYAAKLVEEASKFTLARSELREGINRFIKLINWLIVPIALLLIVSQLADAANWRQIIVRTVAGIVPMIPEGLVLLTSVAFAVGVIRLGARHVLVQELPAIEGLARTDVLCLDKTGTLTEGGMDVDQIRPINGTDGEGVNTALAALAAADDSPNPTMQAVAAHLAENAVADPGWRVIDVMPFSSARKWSGTRFTDNGTWLLGAPDILLDHGDPVALEADMLAAQGMRVLALVTAESASTTGGVTGVKAQALVVLRQRLRETAAATLAYFKEQGVKVKIISGDSPAAVGAVAAQLGVEGAADTVDARRLPEDPEELADLLERATIFGRVKPHQKQAFVKALQSRGHTVAMTGDGVNDVLALKDADLGIAMGSGSAAARSVAQVVLLDDEFATLPQVVDEGRRVLGNIGRVSNLFLTKTVYAISLALFVAVGAITAWIMGNDPLPYPFLPIHQSLINLFTIGLPAFFLALAPTFEKAKPNFVKRVLKFAIPAGICCAVPTFIVYLLSLAHDGTDSNLPQTTAGITLFCLALAALAITAKPYVWWKALLVCGCGGAFLLVLSVPVLADFYELSLPGVWNTTVAAIGVGSGVAALLFWLVVRPKHLAD